MSKVIVNTRLNTGKQEITRMEELKELGANFYQVNLVDLDHPGRTTAYIIKGEKNILIETGASRSNEVISQALEELKIGLDQLDYIIVTHIHLDHAGGAGL
ncbi:MAG: MBL fold metallo-hydrolase, partial [SAR324 cluster bacterium]|nr:MBL fold metallo-hydrolase [SAR324 cluster bacterium]